MITKIQGKTFGPHKVHFRVKICIFPSFKVVRFLVKFLFSKKATKIDKIFTINLENINYKNVTMYRESFFSLFCS